MKTLPELPTTIAELQALVRLQAAELVEVRLAKSDDLAQIDRLKRLLDKLRRLLFGQKSEKLVLQIDQLELELEGLYVNQGIRASESAARVEASPVAPLTAPAERKAPREWPDHLPRESKIYPPEAAACPSCGGDWQILGEDVSETLEYVPASFRVIRHVRPRLSCTCCDQMAQAPAPSRPIERSYAGAGLLSHVMVAKYLDHQPIHRQCQIYLREGVELSESTLGDWVGGVHHLLRPLLDCLKDYVFAAEKLHTDDTPIAVLAPGTGKTRQARLWVYTRDDRPAGSVNPPAVWFRYSPDRKGIHPQTHLKDYAGILQADAYAGYDAVYASGRVLEAGCWAHARRKFHDIHAHAPTPLSTGALAQIAAFYAIESEIRGSPPEQRQAIREARTQPLMLAFKVWLLGQLATLSRKSVMADAINYSLNHWAALTRFTADGRIEIDNNAAERALRTVALGRKNYLFLGSDVGGERAATLYSLLGTAKLNDINPEAYLRHVLTVIADYPVNRVSALLPWRVAL